MSRFNTVPLPNGWTGGGRSFEHEDGAVIERTINPHSEIIEWHVLHEHGDTFTGQDLHAAFHIGAIA